MKLQNSGLACWQCFTAILCSSGAGGGASPEGKRPFLDTLDLETGEKERIWQSQDPYLEATSALLNAEDPDAPVR